MLYTVGKKETYDARFQDEDSGPVKVGKREDYSGGSVFYTKEKARAYCPEDFEVYGLDTTEKSVEPNPDEPWDNLIENAPLVQLD
jgi:hypothetical protein